MAEPFSLAASVVGVAVAALQTSKKLHSLVQDFREAPRQLKMLAEQIERDATFLKCSVELICDHKALFRDELVGLVRNINGQFANIHELIKKLSRESGSRKRDRFKKLVHALWHSKKIENIIVQLEALRSTLALILGIAQYAEQRASRKVTSSRMELFRAQTSQAIDDCRCSLLRLHKQQYYPLPEEHRRLLTFDQSPEDMAVWMAVNLSAPSIPAKQLLGPADSSTSLGIAKSHPKQNLPFGNIPRAKPEYLGNEGMSGCEVVFHAGALDIRTLQSFGLPYQEDRNLDGTHRLTIKTKDTLQPHEVDMIIGMDVMTKFARLKDWPTDQAPLLYMSKDVILRRLLEEWTNLDTGQIQETIGASFQEDADIDSDSDGGASTALGCSDGQWSSSDEQRIHHPLSRQSKRGRTKDLGPMPLAERYDTSMERMPHAEPTWYGIEDDPSNTLEAACRRRVLDASRHTGQNSVPMSAPPGLAPGQRHENKSHGYFHRLDPGRIEGVPHLTPPTFPPQGPAAPRPIPKDWTNSPETTDKATGGSRKPRDPIKPSFPRNHSNIERVPVPYMDEESARPLVEISRSHPKDNVPTIRGADPQTHTMIKEDNSINQARSLAEIQAEISQIEAILQDYKDPVRNGSSTDDAITGIRDKTDTISSRVVDKVGCCERAMGKCSNETLPQRNHDLEDLRSELKAQIREEVNIEFRRQQDLQETYNKTFEKRYAEMKRQEAEKQQLIDGFKEQAKAELTREREGANMRVPEVDRLRERLGRMTEADNPHVEAQQRACQGHGLKEESIQQFRDFSQDISSDFKEAHLLQTSVQRYEAPRMEHDIMSFLTEGTETASTSAWSSSAGSIHGDISDDTDIVKVKSGDKEHRNAIRNSDVERSRPWKGPAHLGSFIELTPLYVRGSDAGQTWYHGPEPVYMIEFQAGYDGDFVTQADVSDGVQPYKRPYLLVSQLWVDAEALDRFGFKYAEGPPSHFFLDPNLSWESIEVLVNFTYALREVDTFKKQGPGRTVGERIFCRSPPPPDFFIMGGIGEALNSSSTRQEDRGETPKGEQDAEKKPWSLTRRLMHALTVLNFAVHTIT